MSLINQMLQDLDARQSENGRVANLPNDVRPLPALRKSRAPVILGGISAVVLVLGYSLTQWDLWPKEAAPVPQVSPVVLAPVPAPVQEANPVALQEKTVQPEAISANPLAKETLPLQGIEGSLRLSDAIKSPVEKKLEKKGEVKPVATIVSAASSGKPAASEKKTSDEPSRIEAAERQITLTPPSPQQVAGKSGKTPMIERTEAAGSPRERADAEYRKAINAVNLGRISEATEGLRNALRQDGQHSASRQLLVKLLLEAKRPDEAIQALQEGLQEQPANTGWAMTLARLQVDRGDLAGAWQTLDHSLPAAGNSADFQGFAAHVLQRLGRNKEAAERYLAATRLSPGEGRWWLGLGLVLDAEGRSSEAKEAFLRAKQCGNLSAELSAMIEQKLR